MILLKNKRFIKKVNVNYKHFNILIKIEDWHSHFVHKDVNQSIDIFCKKID